MTDRYDPNQDEPVRDEGVNQLDTEQLLADWFAEDAPRQEPPVLLPATLARTAMTRRRPKWFTRDWWLSVLGLVDRRPPTMMVSVGFLAILTALALVAALVVAPGDEPEESEVPSHTLVVAADGSGDFETVGEAVVAAADGNTILVMPGEYTEAIDTAKSLTYRGGGADRSDVVIRGDTSAEQVFRLDQATTRFEQLSIVAGGVDTAQPSPIGGVVLVKGSTDFEDVVISGFGKGCGIETRLVGDQIWAGVDLDIAVTIDTSLFTDGDVGICSLDTLRVGDSVFRGLDSGINAEGGIEVVGSTFEQNRTGLVVGGELRLTDSRFIGNGTALEAGDAGIDGEWTVVANDFIDNATAMSLGFGGIDVRDNKVSGGDVGLRLESRRRGSVADNEFSGISGPAIEALGARGDIERNTITDSGAGILLAGGVPDVRENRVERVAGIGVSVGGDTGGNVVGNVLCDNGTDLEVADDASATVADNTICDR